MDTPLFRQRLDATMARVLGLVARGPCTSADLRALASDAADRHRVGLAIAELCQTGRLVTTYDPASGRAGVLTLPR